MHLEALLAGRADLWRGAAPAVATPSGPSTGCATLDRALPWGGWPHASLTEVLTAEPEAALTLLLPVLIALSSQPRWLLLVDPPLLPYAPALLAHGLALSRLVLVYPGAGTAWAMEQALRAGSCALVLGWTGSAGTAPDPGQRMSRTRQAADTGAAWSMPHLRRLQLAAVAGDAIVVLVRPAAAAQAPSPAALRLLLSTTPAGLECGLLKVRGGRAGGRVLFKARAASYQPPAASRQRSAASRQPPAVSSQRSAVSGRVTRTWYPDQGERLETLDKSEQSLPETTKD